MGFQGLVARGGWGLGELRRGGWEVQGEFLGMVVNATSLPIGAEV